MTLRIGTRGSALAVAQTQLVADALAAALGGTDVEIVRVTTHGDTSRASLSSLGGTGVFATALRDALREGRCDVVVHSFKDLPTAASPGLIVGAVPPREDPRDVVVTRDGTPLADLPAGARIGTGSPRRIAQVRAARPDLDLVDIRGNVDSRLARLHADGDERLDAVILSAAGLNRLGRTDVPTEPMPLETWPSAPAQGALAVEVRDNAAGTPLAAALARIADPRSAATAAAERGVLAGLQAGCSAPVGATATVQDGALHLTAAVYSLDGTRRISASHTIPHLEDEALPEAAAEAARIVTAQLLGDGAADLAPVGARGDA
ncbi:hydroxymethylbilane synthase [Microbacterium sp. SYP-A9085]|uniref:hydroxymethylbilane synthase n=1 Tax=Microbacterium sp. SYP-A9085 TaxID=2664454 RepID=UPI00129BD611|nr:hydroxymethylbilane synthase [Microbacterium sp. SYP-A9085]MRH28558.1 hydroxymethylbilane synthase [Microbacterium sp. SYP-A9085]